MAYKPDWTTYWGDDIDPEDIETPPMAKAEAGWSQYEKPPYQWFNYLFALIELWLKFLEEYSATHTHNGGGGDFDAPKIDPDLGIDWTTRVSGTGVNARNTPYAVGKVSASGSLLAGLGVLPGDVSKYLSTPGQYRIDLPAGKSSSSAIPVVTINESGSTDDYSVNSHGLLIGGTAALIVQTRKNGSPADCAFAFTIYGD